jgi:uncharacterized repeat protein (TIGR01451 family)
MSDFIEATRAFFAASNNVRGSIAALFVLLTFVSGTDAQRAKRQSSIKQSAPTAASLSTTLTDAFPDANGDGKASPGETVTYTATVTNNGTTQATNVVYSSPVDQNSAYVANSASARSDAVDGSLIYRTFYTGGGGGEGGTGGAASIYKSGGYNSTDDNLNTVFGGQNDHVNFMTSNASYNAETGIFRFDGVLQNLLPTALGTLDGSTLDAAGIQMIVQKITVNSGSGTVTPIDPASFRYDQIIAENDITAPKTFQFNVPNTVTSFTVGFLVSTKVQLKLVINEVLVNPRDPITDADGEWFELYNAGRFPVNLQNFLINDAINKAMGVPPEPGEECFPTDSSRCHRPPFTVSTNLTMEPGAYLVFGNTTNTTLNGGVPVDYAYGAVMALANSRDSIRIRTPAATGALTVDMTQYASAAVSAQNGISRELRNPALDNGGMDFSNWSDASVTSVYGNGGRGTPKAQNGTYTPFWAGNETPPEKSDALFAAGAIGKNDASDAAQSAPLAGETVTVNLGTIPAGESVVVTYQVTIANPLPAGTTEISTQGTVSGDNFASSASDDPTTDAANDATATPVQAIAPIYSIAGTIKYGTTNVGQPDSFVSGVNLNVTGTATSSAISDGSGVYQLSDLAAGNYTATPSKTGEVKGINSLDATRIQQHLVGLITLTPNQLIAADTDGNGTVNSLDATRIQQRLVGIQSSNIIGQWKFVPASRQYNALSSNQSGQDYVAILVGEVSGNWATAASFADDSETDEEILPKQDVQSDAPGKFEDELSQQIAERMKQSAVSQLNELVSNANFVSEQ